MSETFPYSYPIQSLLRDKIHGKCMVWPDLKNEEITSHLRHPGIILKHLSENAMQGVYWVGRITEGI